MCVADERTGATNLVTGLATAQMDSVPLVAITGQVGRPAIGKDSFQETNVMGMTLPFTKHSFLVEDPDELYPTMRRAFEIARSGRPGPVLVDVPEGRAVRGHATTTATGGCGRRRHRVRVARAGAGGDAPQEREAAPDPGRTRGHARGRRDGAQAARGAGRASRS